MLGGWQQCEADPSQTLADPASTSNVQRGSGRSMHTELCVAVPCSAVPQPAARNSVKKGARGLALPTHPCCCWAGSRWEFPPDMQGLIHKQLEMTNGHVLSSGITEQQRSLESTIRAGASPSSAQQGRQGGDGDQKGLLRPPRLTAAHRSRRSRAQSGINASASDHAGRGCSMVCHGEHSHACQGVATT